MGCAVAVEPGTGTEAPGVAVPDMLRCFCAGDTMEEAMAMAEVAIAAWIETALDTGQDMPQPSSADALRKKNQQWKTRVWAVVQVEPALLVALRSEQASVCRFERLYRLDA